MWVCLEEMTERRQPQQKHKVRGNDSVNGNRENKRSGREIGGRKKKGLLGMKWKKRKKTDKRKRKERLKNVWNAERWGMQEDSGIWPCSGMQKLASQ